LLTENESVCRFPCGSDGDRVRISDRDRDRDQDRDRGRDRDRVGTINSTV
jgi:hypothetical protein